MKCSLNGSLFKYLLKSFLCQRWAFRIIHSIDFHCQIFSLFKCNWCFSLFLKLWKNSFIVSKINFSSNKDERNFWTKVLDLREPFRADILEWTLTDNTETDEKNVCSWVRERAETIIIFLTCSVMDMKVDRVVFNKEILGICIGIVWHILCGKWTKSIGDKHRCLADSTITHKNSFYILNNWHKIVIEKKKPFDEKKKKAFHHFQTVLQNTAIVVGERRKKERSK